MSMNKKEAQDLYNRMIGQPVSIPKPRPKNRILKQRNPNQNQNKQIH